MDTIKKTTLTKRFLAFFASFAVLAGGALPIETPALIRYGQLTYDEYFVSAKAAKDGVVIENTSQSDPIVMLKHFAENPDLEKLNK